MINDEKLEDVIEELKTAKTYFPMRDYVYAAIQDAIDLLTPREITKEEWEQWKKTNYRDPLYYIWTDDATLTPLLAMKPSDIHEPAYLMGKIKIFNTKPTRAQRMKMIEERESGVRTMDVDKLKYLMAKIILDSNRLEGGYGGVALCINCKERGSDKYINLDGVEVSACDICVNNEQAVKIND